jgi:peptide deformylase
MLDNEYISKIKDFLVVRKEPDPILREISKRVLIIDAHLKSFMYSLLNIMRKEDGIGIAAIQVGVPIRAFIVHIPNDQEETEIFFMINPVIKSLSKEVIILPEGCLSVKTLEDKFQRGLVERPKHITINYTDLNNTHHTLTIDADQSEYHLWLARCIQHEYDHLDGILFIDKVIAEDNIRED